jgi:hypothetical protein
MTRDAMPISRIFHILLLPWLCKLFSRYWGIFLCTSCMQSCLQRNRCMLSSIKSSHRGHHGNVAVPSMCNRFWVGSHLCTNFTILVWSMVEKVCCTFYCVSHWIKSKICFVHLNFSWLYCLIGMCPADLIVGYPCDGYIGDASCALAIWEATEYLGTKYFRTRDWTSNLETRAWLKYDWDSQLELCV